MAVDREGRIVLTLEDGQVLCLERVPQADINEDGEVNLEDLAVMAGQWRQELSTPSADIGPTSAGDGVVDLRDIAVLAEYWLTYPGAVAHWKLDETEGDIAQDSTGQHDGTLNGDPQWQPLEGRIAGALELDGKDDYLETGFVVNPADGAFSIFAWIKEGGPGQVIVSQESGVNWLMADPTNGALRTNLRTTATTGRGGKPAGPPLICSTVVTDGDWHRVGLVRDGDDRILYVDDIEVARDTAETLESAEGGLYIGAGSGLQYGAFWSGLIDDVRIYNRAVTP
jgi:hypothetical protein